MSSHPSGPLSRSHPINPAATHRATTRSASSSATTPSSRTSRSSPRGASGCVPPHHLISQPLHRTRSIRSCFGGLARCGGAGIGHRPCFGESMQPAPIQCSRSPILSSCHLSKLPPPSSPSTPALPCSNTLRRTVRLRNIAGQSSTSPAPQTHMKKPTALLLSSIIITLTCGHLRLPWNERHPDRGEEAQRAAVQHGRQPAPHQLRGERPRGPVGADSRRQHPLGGRRFCPSPALAASSSLA